MPASTTRQRRQAIRLVGKETGDSIPVRRALLVQPLGAEAALPILRDWKVPGKDLRLAEVLLGIRIPRRDPSCRETVALLRSVTPFHGEVVDFLDGLGSTGAARLARRLRPLVRGVALRRLRTPVRPFDTRTIAAILGLAEGPRLGKALRDLDLALACAEVRGKKAARRFLLSR
jgi:hypothetical protein